MWILTPGSTEYELVNLQHFTELCVQKLTPAVYGLLAIDARYPDEPFVILKTGSSPEPLFSILLGIESCHVPGKGLPMYVPTTPTLH